jgi:hypothetical protein
MGRWYFPLKGGRSRSETPKSNDPSIHPGADWVIVLDTSLSMARTPIYDNSAALKLLLERIQNAGDVVIALDLDSDSGGDFWKSREIVGIENSKSV